MKCEEFQKALPKVLEGEAGAEEAAHLRSCSECSDLAQDLQAITREAGLLAASVEPHPRVWQRIRAAAELEGLVHSEPAAADPAAADPPPVWVLPRFAWASPALASAFVVLLLVAGALLYRNIPVTPSAAPTVAEAPAPAMDANDQKVLASVADQDRARYERNLKNVNAYIREAKRNVEANPDDEDARDSLRQAYEQKTLIYDMAMSRSMQ